MRYFFDLSVRSLSCMWVGMIFERSASFFLVLFLRILNILPNFNLFIDELLITFFVISEIISFRSIVLVLFFFLNKKITKNHLFEIFVDIQSFFDEALG
jgi:hypothetical protein